MAGLFSKPKAPKLPPVPPPAAIPQTGSEASDLAERQAQRRAGIAQTILTGDLETKPTGRRRLLGGG